MDGILSFKFYLSNGQSSPVIGSITRQPDKSFEFQKGNLPKKVIFVQYEKTGGLKFMQFFDKNEK